ncbi:MAG: hypothetical protein F6K50_08420 [Moorea sp. SIO3I7]|nr:hypothetical protein [Moorena sp. SIO3I7]
MIKISNNDWLEPTKDLFASLDLGFFVLAHEDESQIMADYRLIRSLEQQLKLDPRKKMSKSECFLSNPQAKIDFTHPRNYQQI